MKRLTFALRFWSTAQSAADALSRVFAALSTRCQKRATAANMALLSTITARR